MVPAARWRRRLPQELAKGLLLGEAVGEAKTYIGKAIAAADRLDIGSGRGPLHHFFKWW